MYAFSPRCVVLLGAFSALVGCSTLDIPSAPNLEANAAQYESPNASLDVEEATQSFQDTVDKFEAIGGKEFFTFLKGLAEQIVTFVDTNVAPVETKDSHQITKLNLDSVIRLHRRCGADSLEASQERGTLDLTATIENGRLGTVMWGTAVQCKSPTGNQIDGDIAIYFYEGFDAESPPTLMVLNGTLTKGEITISGELSLRFIGDQLDILIPLTDVEYVIATTGGPFGTGIRAANAAFACNFETLECVVGE